MDIDVNDKVRHIKYGFTGNVSNAQLKRVLTETNEGFTFIPRVVVTIRLTVAGMYGEYADFIIDELTVLK